MSTGFHFLCEEPWVEEGKGAKNRITPLGFIFLSLQWDEGPNVFEMRVGSSKTAEFHFVF